jgi:hypothetical protein
MPISQTCAPKWIARLYRHAAAGWMMTIAAVAGQADTTPRPHTFDTTPAPSSFILLLAGMIGLLAWNWWRTRPRGPAKLRD